MAKAAGASKFCRHQPSISSKCRSFFFFIFIFYLLSLMHELPEMIMISVLGPYLPYRALAVWLVELGRQSTAQLYFLVKGEVKETFRGPVCKILQVAPLTAGFIFRPSSGLYLDQTCHQKCQVHWSETLIALDMVLLILELFLGSGHLVAFVLLQMCTFLYLFLRSMLNLYQGSHDKSSQTFLPGVLMF